MSLFSLGIAAPYLAIALILLVFALFVSEKLPAEVVAFSGACLALVLGLITTEDIQSAIANPAPVTIAAMFILSAALVRTGLIESAVGRMSDLAKTRPTLTILVFFGAASASSAVMNNTPVVMVLIPVAVGLARQIGTGSSKLLLPLSYMVILGGTMTMIGTSTNLLVDGVARDLGMQPFGLFEIAPLGLMVALVGAGYLALIGVRLLPKGGPSATQATSNDKRWLAELFIPARSTFVGKSLNEFSQTLKNRSRVIDVVRGDLSLRHDLSSLKLEAGDTVVVRSRDVAVMGFRERAAANVVLQGYEAAQARRTIVMEVLIGPHSKAVGRRLEDLRWRRRYGVYAMALHRQGEQVRRLEQTELSVGDMLLLDGAAADIARLAEDLGLTVLSPNETRAFRPTKAPIAVAVLTAVVGLAAFDIAPILPLALIGCAIVLLTRCLDADEAMEAMDGRLLLLIVSMLVLGSALSKSGALDLIVTALQPIFTAMPPIAALALIYTLTSVLTEMVTNNAVAVVMTPIAAGIAASLGLDPRGFVVAVMFGASASFATPIGYQTNTLVYNAGGYRFVDFLKVGVPMNIIAGIATVLLIPMIWPL